MASGLNEQFEVLQTCLIIVTLPEPEHLWHLNKKKYIKDWSVSHRASWVLPRPSGSMSHHSGQTLLIRTSIHIWITRECSAVNNQSINTHLYMIWAEIYSETTVMFTAPAVAYVWLDSSGLPLKPAIHSNCHQFYWAIYCTTLTVNIQASHVAQISLRKLWSSVSL